MTAFESVPCAYFGDHVEMSEGGTDFASTFGIGGVIGSNKPGHGVEYPKLQHEVRPNYTQDALKAKIQGSALVEAVVLPDGRVGDAKIARSLDKTHGLDQEALKAAKQWVFAPGDEGRPTRRGADDDRDDIYARQVNVERPYDTSWNRPTTRAHLC